MVTGVTSNCIVGPGMFANMGPGCTEEQEKIKQKQEWNGHYKKETNYSKEDRKDLLQETDKSFFLNTVCL